MADARQTGRPVVVEDADDLATRYSDPPAGFETTSLQSILAIPLPELTEGTVHGALGFGWTEPQELALADLDVASTIAELVAGALARARSMDQVRTKAALEEQRADIATALMDATTVDRVARRTLAVLARQLQVAWGYVAVGDTTREEPLVRATLPDRREHQDWDVPAFDHLGPGATPWMADAVLQRLSGGEPIGRCEALVIPGGPIHVVVVAGWRPQDDGSSGLGARWPTSSRRPPSAQGRVRPGGVDGGGAPGRPADDGLAQPGRRVRHPLPAGRVTDAGRRRLVRPRRRRRPRARDRR